MKHLPTLLLSLCRPILHCRQSMSIQHRMETGSSLIIRPAVHCKLCLKQLQVRVSWFPLMSHTNNCRYNRQFNLNSGCSRLCLNSDLLNCNKFILHNNNNNHSSSSSNTNIQNKKYRSSIRSNRGNNIYNCHL